MRTKNLMMAMAALAMAGCSQNEVTDVNPDAHPVIGFDVYTGVQTKGAETDMDALKVSASSRIRRRARGVRQALLPRLISCTTNRAHGKPEARRAAGDIPIPVSGPPTKTRSVSSPMRPMNPARLTEAVRASRCPEKRIRGLLPLTSS